jgi:O-antigen ligase
MKPEKIVENKFSLWLFYQCFLVIIAVLIFFTNFDVYSGLIGKSNPIVYIILLVIASLPLYFSIFKRYKFLSASLLIWCFVYVTISIFSLAYFTQISEIAKEELRHRILAVIFMITMNVIFSKYDFVQKIARISIFFFTIINVLNNIFELANPAIFNNLNETGRPAGLYINSNMSGSALNMGMVFSVNVIPKKFRLIFVIFVGIGVLITFSRGGIIAWIMVVILFLKNQVIPRNQVFYSIGLVGAFNLLGIPSLISLIMDTLDDMGLMNKNIRGRIIWFEDASSSDANQDTSRSDILEFGWKLFLQHPILGNGLAATQTWTEPIATHNMYLNFMVEHGFLGALIMPLLIYAVIKNARGETKTIGFIFAALMLLRGIFSHHILSERFSLMLFSLMASMTTQSRLNQLSPELSPEKRER